MGIASKGLLLFNTIKYLKPSQIFNQVLHRLRPQEGFAKCRKKPIKVSEYSLWIEELDQEQKQHSQVLVSQYMEELQVMLMKL